MQQPDSRLLQWRERLRCKDGADVIPDSAIDELCAIAKQQVEFYYRDPKRLSPPALSRELSQLAKGLNRAAKAIEAIGSQGMTNLYAASCSNSEFDDFAPHLHSAYVLQMSKWAERAASTADPDAWKLRVFRKTSGCFQQLQSAGSMHVSTLSRRYSWSRRP